MLVCSILPQLLLCDNAGNVQVAESTELNVTYRAGSAVKRVSILMSRNAKCCETRADLAKNEQ